MTLEFQEFPKIPRYRREMTVTEKIDGTNAAVVWYPADDGGEHHKDIIATETLLDQHGTNIGRYHLLAQSRNRFVVPEVVRKGGDNHGFGKWVEDNAGALTRLGPGVHYGEWWGLGIQRGYGQTRKRFSLFNLHRWNNESRPECCDVVPILGYGTPSDGVVEDALAELTMNGSKAAPGFMSPEGIIVYHGTSKQYFKVMLQNDDTPKTKIKERSEMQSEAEYQIGRDYGITL
jgi:hypothetical protein